LVFQVVFEKCSGLHDSPSALLVNGLQHCQIIATEKDDPLTFGYVPGQSRDAAFQQLKTFAFVLHPTLGSRPEDGIIGDEGMGGINAILQAAPNMRSFAFSNIPVFSSHGPIGALHLPGQIVETLSAMRLKSLTLVGPVLVKISQYVVTLDLCQFLDARIDIKLDFGPSAIRCQICFNLLSPPMGHRKTS
jgi:hypothetical protein